MWVSFCHQPHHGCHNRCMSEVTLCPVAVWDASESSSPGSRLPGLNYLLLLPVSNLTIRGLCKALGMSSSPQETIWWQKLDTLEPFFGEWFIPTGMDKYLGECFDCLIPQASPWGSGIFHQHRLSQNIASDWGTARKKWWWWVPHVESTVCTAHRLHLCLPDRLTLQRWDAIFQVA